MKKFSFIILVAIFGVLSSKVYAQSSNPLYSVPENEKPGYIGIYFGLGQNFQAGKIYPQCPDCEFEKGNKFGFTAGIFYEYKWFEHFNIGAAIEYNYLGIDAYFQEIESHLLDIPVNASVMKEKVNLTFQHTANLDIHNLSLVPYAKFQPFEFMYLKLGIGLGINISNHFVHQKSLAQRTVKLSNGETAVVSINKDNTILENDKLADATPFQVYISPELGFNIPLSKKLTFTPAFSYSQAIMNVSSLGVDPKVNYWRILLGLKYELEHEYF